MCVNLEHTAYPEDLYQCHKTCYTLMTLNLKVLEWVLVIEEIEPECSKTCWVGIDCVR